MKVYKCEGLVIDLQDGERVILCQTDCDVFTPFSIGTYTVFNQGAPMANRWGVSHNGRNITREQVVKLFDVFKVKAIRQPKKLRIVCS